MLKMYRLVAGLLLLGFMSCAKINLYEQQAAIPNQQWEAGFKPSFTFEIEDTAALYNIYVVVRHTDMYEFNNVWLKISTQAPGDSLKSQNVNIRLATSTGWLGTGMSDIFEVRRLLTNGPTGFKKAGNYTFTFEQIMRENPLEHIMNVGLRIEKLD